MEEKNNYSEYTQGIEEGPAAGRCDLHSHTQASDGMQPPAENVRLAYEKGLAAVAITDHDTVSGIAEALEAGKRLGITVVPGVEISTRAGGKEIHVLGYYIDTEQELFLSRLEQQRNTRLGRNEVIIDKLRGLGIEISMEQVLSGMGRELKPDESVGRPHIADELVRLGAAADMRDAFDNIWLKVQRRMYRLRASRRKPPAAGYRKRAVRRSWPIPVFTGMMNWCGRSWRPLLCAESRSTIPIMVRRSMSVTLRWLRNSACWSPAARISMGRGKA